MADNTSLISLATLDTAKTSAARDKGVSRFRTSSSSGYASTTRGKAGFDGLLKTFLGEDKSGSVKKSGLSRGRNASQKQEKSASLLDRLSDDDEQNGNSSAARRSEKYRELAELQEDMQSDAIVSDAACAAWEILCGHLNLINPFSPEDGVGELTAGALDTDLLQNALDGTNASALDNNSAILSATEEFIAAMTDAELEEALAHVVANDGDVYADVDMDALNRMMDELNARVESVGGGEDGLLASLAGNAVHRGGSAENIAGQAETSGSFDESWLSGEGEENIFSEFSKFIKEMQSNDPEGLSAMMSGDDSGQLLASFAEWLSDNGNASDASKLREHPNAFIQAVRSRLDSEGGQGAGLESGDSEIKEVFSQVKKNLETLLQSNANVKASEADSLPGQAERKLNQGIFENVQGEGIPEGHEVSGQGVVPGHHHSGSTPSLARADSTNPASMSTMMDQIENIERIAEAVKMANRNGLKHITVQLTPDELGKVTLKVEARDGVVNAYLRVEKPDTVSQLGDSLSQLRSNLKAAGVELGELVIEQRDFNDSLGYFGGQRQGGGESREAGRNRIHWSRERDGEGSSEQGVTGTSTRNAAGALDFLA